MAVNSKVILEKISRVRAASDAGLLNKYAPATSANDANAVLTSWGPAMRR